MTFTNFPQGVASLGIPTWGVGGPINIDPAGKVWFVNGDALAAGDGSNPASPLTTMGALFNSGALGSGDTIYFQGNIREQLLTPAGIFNVTIIGNSPTPVYADAHTVSGINQGGYSGATWRAPASPVALTPLLTIRQQGWRLINFTYAAAPASTPQVRVFRDAGVGDAERDGSRATFYGMLFAGGPIGIQMSGGPANVWIKGCHFQDASDTAIAYTVGAGVGVNLDHVIENCVFDGCVNNIILPATNASIRGNVLGIPTTKNISLTNGSGNMVGPGNIIGVASSYNNDNDPGSSATWAGNFVIAGITVANPT